MAVIEELQSIFRHVFAGFVEHSGGLTARLLIEVALVRNPGDTGVLEAELFGFARDAFRVILVTAIIEMGANGLDATRGQLLGKLPSREAISAGHLGVLNAPTLYFIERTGDILRELLP